MKYICKDCGRTYSKKPTFCECGCDFFSEKNDGSSQQKRAIAPKPCYEQKKTQAKATKAKKSDDRGTKLRPFTVFVVMIFVALIAYFVPLAVKYKAEEAQRRAANSPEATYLDRMMQTILEDFSPAGIESSDYCIVSFEINENGGINKRFFVRRSSVPEINNKVMHALKKATIVEEPPKKYINVPLNINVSCTADEEAAECLSNIYVKK